MRAQLNETILAIATAMPSSIVPGVETESPRTVATADGAVLMKRFVVKSVVPTASEVSPLRSPPLLSFASVERAARRTKPAWQMPLLDFMGGYLHVDVVNGGGQGVDHGRDFTRVELGFTKRF